jgi:hypothetical protein
LLKDTLALFNSNRDSFAEQIVSDNYEGLDKYNDKHWFKYQDSDTKKWHIVPKIKAFEVTNTEYKMTE